MRALLIPLICSALMAADLPVNRVVLYKHGVAYFERSGIVRSDEEIRLSLDQNETNDVLKSLTVSDDGHGMVQAVRYDANETLEQKLSKFPFAIRDAVPFSAFLDGMKGARIELALQDGTNVSGSILSARVVEKQEQMSVLTDSGMIVNYDLAKLASVKFADARLQSDLKEYLQTLARGKSQGKRSVTIATQGKGERNVRIAYIAPTAVWKSSYRLELSEGKSLLEGWAHVDNTTDEDWNDVKLSVVSGRPISFISELDTPRYGNRQVVELPDDAAAGPVVYGGALEVVGNADAGAAGGVLGGVVGGAGAVPPPPPAPPIPGRQFVANQLMAPKTMTKSALPTAEGASMGELFEYSFAGPITVKRNESAMLPFLRDTVQARKLLIYTEDAGSEHPVNAAEITNATGKTLDGGPITIYADGAYGGEALFETLKAGDKRLIGYAVDYGTRVRADNFGQGRLIGSVQAKDGILQVKYAQRNTHTYTAENLDDKPKTLVIEQDAADYKLISPQPVERTAKAYRFEMNLPAKSSRELKVEQETWSTESVALTSSTPDQITLILTNAKLSDPGKAALSKIADLKNQIAAIEARQGSVKSQLQDLNQEQSRVRANIQTLNQVRSQSEEVAKYTAQLSSEEVSITHLRDEAQQLENKRAQLDSDLRDQIDRMQF